MWGSPHSLDTFEDCYSEYSKVNKVTAHWLEVWITDERLHVDLSLSIIGPSSFRLVNDKEFCVKITDRVQLRTGGCRPPVT